MAKLYTGIAILVALLLSAVILPAPNREAEGRQIPPDVFVGLELSNPGGAFHNTAADSETAFREEDAGFSAYYRVPELAGDDASPLRLDIEIVTDKLKAVRDESDTDRFRDSPGEVIEQGVNFATVKIAMNAAMGQPDELQEITTYYDDRGWIVAYLPVDEPAAAIWKYHPTDDASGSRGRRTSELLANNLLIIGINAVLKANDPAAAAVTHEMAGYYHWQHPQCDAFILFSNQTKYGKSPSVSIVIPPTIGSIQASAAALIAGIPVEGETATASVLIDGTAVVTANAPDYLAVSPIDDPPPISADPEYSSVYRMAVSGDADKLIAGVVMLVYDKPGS